MEPDYHAMATDLLNSGMGDNGRLKFILECIAKDKPLYKTDIIFLESMNNKLEAKIQKLQTSAAAPKVARQKKAEEVSKVARQKKAEEVSKVARQKKVVKDAPKAVKQKKAEEVPNVVKQKSGKTKTLISDEHLDQHLDQLSGRNNARKTQAPSAIEKKKKKKSFFARLFSK